MTIIYSIEAFNKSDECLAFEVEIPTDKLGSLKIIMNWNDDVFEDFIAGGGGYDLTIEQVKSMEKVLGKRFYSDLYDFQIDSGKIYS